MAPGGVEPPHADSKSAALSTELRGPRPSVPRQESYPVQAFAVAVAQLVEPRVVVPVVAGSSPVRHPRAPAGEHLRPAEPASSARLTPLTARRYVFRGRTASDVPGTRDGLSN